MTFSHSLRLRRIVLFCALTFIFVTPALSEPVRVRIENTYNMPIVIVPAEPKSKRGDTPGIRVRKEPRILTLQKGQTYLVFSMVNPYYRRAKAKMGEHPAYLKDLNIRISPFVARLRRPITEFTVTADPTSHVSYDTTQVIPGTKVELENHSRFEIKFRAGIINSGDIPPGAEGRVAPDAENVFTPPAGDTYVMVPQGTEGSISRPIQRSATIAPGRNVLAYPDAVYSDPTSGWHPSSQRRYDRQTYLMAHNATFSRAYGWAYSQQNLTLTELWKFHGIRAFEIDVHWWQAPERPAKSLHGPMSDFQSLKVVPKRPAFENDLYLCHHSCDLSLEFLRKDQTLRTFMDVLEEIEPILRDPLNEQVMTLFLETKVLPGTTVTDMHLFILFQLTQMGLEQYVFFPDVPGVRCRDRMDAFWGPGYFDYHDVTTPGGNFNAPHHVWPTIGEMVRAGKKLVIFVDKGNALTRCLPDTWSYVWENEYSRLPVQDQFRDDIPLDEHGSYMGPFSNLPIGLEQRDESRASTAYGRTLFRFNNFPRISMTADYGSINSAEFIYHRLLNLIHENPDAETPGFGASLPNFIALDFADAADLRTLARDFMSFWGGDRAQDEFLPRKWQNKISLETEVKSSADTLGSGN